MIIYLQLFQDELNNEEMPNSKEDVPENAKEISNDNNLDKEKEKDKIIETSSSKTKKHINISDEISMKEDEIDEIATSRVEKNKEDNALKIEDKKCEKEDINKVMANDEEKATNKNDKIANRKNEEKKLISKKKKNVKGKKEKDNNTNPNLLGKKRTLNACRYIKGIPVIIDLSPDAEWYKILKKQKSQK